MYDLRGGVEIDYEDYVILADHATYDTTTGQVDAEGHLQVTGGPDNEDFAADHGTRQSESADGSFLRRDWIGWRDPPGFPSQRVHPQNFWASAVQQPKPLHLDKSISDQRKGIDQERPGKL